jgi:hypothetical protein
LENGESATYLPRNSVIGIAFAARIGAIGCYQSMPALPSVVSAKV